MSVSSTTSSVTYAGNASTSAAYPVPFQFFDATDLVVVVNTAGVPTTLVLGTGYTVSGGAGSTGSIVTTSAIPATSTVIISRNTAKTQLTSYTTGDRFPASTHEKALDKLTMLVQEATATAAPPTSTASGAAPYVLQASSVGANPSWVPQSTGGIAAGAITNTMLAGGITPGKLSTGGPVWDTSGNLTAASFVGNASTATSAAKLTTPRTIGLSGSVVGTASFDGSANVTIAATLGTNEQKQICKAWVNFNGYAFNVNQSAATGWSIVTTAGSDVAVWNVPGAVAFYVGVLYFLPSIGGVAGATLGGVNVATIGIQITALNNASQYAIKLLAGPATSSQTINGNGTSSGFTYTERGVRSSYNVSSVTRNGTGSYTVNYATPMADANYVCMPTATVTSTINNPITYPVSQTTTSSTIQIVRRSDGVADDSSTVEIMVFGN